MFEKLLFQNLNSQIMRDKYVPDHSEVHKPKWTSAQYLLSQIENNKADPQRQPGVAVLPLEVHPPGFIDPSDNFQNALGRSAGTNKDETGQDNFIQPGIQNAVVQGVLSPSGDCDNSISLPGLDEGHDFKAGTKVTENKESKRP